MPTRFRETSLMDPNGLLLQRLEDDARRFERLEKKIDDLAKDLSREISTIGRTVTELRVQRDAARAGVMALMGVVVTIAAAWVKARLGL
jgi:hypothetical protein